MCPSADANAPQFVQTSPPVCPDFIGTFRLSLAGVAAFARLKVSVSDCPAYRPLYSRRVRITELAPTVSLDDRERLVARLAALKAGLP